MIAFKCNLHDCYFFVFRYADLETWIIILSPLKRQKTILLTAPATKN